MSHTHTRTPRALLSGAHSLRKSSLLSLAFINADFICRGAPMCAPVGIKGDFRADTWFCHYRPNTHKIPHGRRNAAPTNINLNHKSVFRRDERKQTTLPPVSERAQASENVANVRRFSAESRLLFRREWSERSERERGQRAQALRINVNP